MENRPWVKNYDQGVAQSINYPQVPLFHFLEDSAQKFPNRPCTIFKGAKISYQEMNERSDRIAGALAALGVKKGDRVGIFMPNTPQFVMVYFGILKAGGVVVATNPLYTPTEIEHQVNDAGIEIMFVMSNFYAKMKAAQPKTRIKTLIVSNLKETLPPVTRLLFTLAKEKKGGFRIEGGLPASDFWLPDLLSKYQPSDRPKLDVGPEDTAMFQYSGGTTGVSKGAVALHRNVVANTLQLKTWITSAKDGEETVLMAIPLFHVYGMVAGMSFALASGATMVMIPNARDIPDVLANINKYSPTIFPGVPTLYTAINNHPDVAAGKVKLGSIKACVSGSAPLMRETKEKFEKLSGGKVFEGYGLSEAPTATHCNPMMGINKTGSIGMPLPDVQCKIISLDDGVTEMATGEIGEIAIRGPQVMKGYHNMPTETANTLRDMNDGGAPWLFTGDIARMDEDGYFYIVDRKKELIKPGGYQVWPREVEEAITANPKVLEAGVAGIPDPYRGETVKAWIVRKDESLSEDEVKAWCKERLAAYKVPTHIEFRGELPKTTVGKILRRELVRQHKEANQ
jgi:long-chain acyl-CoA synthetase